MSELPANSAAVVPKSSKTQCRSRHRAAKHASAESCLWFGDIPASWASERRLKMVIYKLCPSEVPQPWLKRVVPKRYRDRRTGEMLGYAIVCLRDGVEAAFVLQAMNGLQVLASIVYRPDELAEGGQAADLVHDPGFWLRVKPAEHGDVDVLSALPQGMDNNMATEVDPPMIDQLRPLPLAELRRRIELLKVSDIAGGLGTEMEPLAALVNAYERIPRQVRKEQGYLIQTDIASRLLQELEGLRWPAKNHRPVVTSDRYLVLLSCVADDCYSTLRRLCSELMSWADKGFRYSAVAVTKNFAGSPHIDERDRCHQYAVSLGCFSGGELCIDSIDDDNVHRVVVVDTRNRIARIDGRHVHWVRAFNGGNRYSLIFYDTSDRQSEPIGPAFDSGWRPGRDLQHTRAADVSDAHPQPDALGSVTTVDARLTSPVISSNSKVCDGCGQTFSSRNALFRHFQQSGCSGNVRKKVEKCLVIYGYVGTCYHGSQRNAVAEEALYPTVEGTLLSSLQSALLEQRGATDSRVRVLSRTSRTDAGVHALANVVCLMLETDFGADVVEEKLSDISGKFGTVGDAVAESSPKSVQHWILSAAQQLMPPSIGLLQWLPLPSLGFEARHACQKREYWYYVPHDALFLPSDCSTGGCLEEDRCWIWISGLPDDYTAGDLQQLAEDRLREAGLNHLVVEQVEVLGKCSGFIRFSSIAAALEACAVLDGARRPHVDDSHDQKSLMALPKPEALARKTLHHRLRRILGKLTGTRSFHNFSPGFASSTSDPRSVRSVYRCRSEMKNGFNDCAAGRDFAIFKITGRDFLYKQILCMSALVVAVVRGSVPEAYLDLALGRACGVEVPCAPSCNLVLAKCCFRDDAFHNVKEHYRDASTTEMKLQETIVSEIAGDIFKSRFSAFVQELSEDIAPRMCRALSCAHETQ